MTKLWILYVTLRIQTNKCEMKNTSRYIQWSLTLLFGVAVCCFFGLKYPYHLHYQEQYQLFLFTTDYFWETVSVPGGMGDYLGGFLTQFFYVAWAGAVVLAVLLSLVQRLTWHFFVRREDVMYPLSFLPSLLLWAFYADENALLSAAIALLASQMGAAVLCLVKAAVVRRLLFLLLIPPMYAALGSLSLLFVLLLSYNEWRNGRGSVRWGVIGAAWLLALFCPPVFRYWVHFPLYRLFYGVHYYRFPQLMPMEPWIAAMGVFLLSLLSAVRVPCPNKPWARHVRMAFVTLAVASVGGWTVWRNSQPVKEEVMKYDFMVRMRLWNRLMIAAGADNPQTPMTVTALNLALAKSGRMADHMFEYFQNGPEGLLPQFTRDFTSPLPTSEAFYHLGMVNTAQRYTFEAQEAIPDFQKSARAYKRLAETNLVNGDYAVAKKYLQALRHTLFYKKWAEEVLPLLWNEAAIDRHPEYGWLRRIRHRQDFLFSDVEMDSMLGLLFTGCYRNRMAYEYLMAYTLLKKDLKRFYECYPLGQHAGYDHIPRSYQEALVLMWAQQHNHLNGMPWSIAPQTVHRMKAFMKAYVSKQSEAYMRSHFGDTYWFYYFYRYKS